VKNKSARELLLTPNSARSTPNFILTELLTIDADAHLQKLAANIFPSPALLPLELVRCALKRKATFISVHIHSRRISISDNGAGISSEEWRALACAADKCQNAAAREEAVAGIKKLSGPGIGMLAVFIPGARNMQIENSGPAGKSTMRLAAGRVKLQNICSWPQGTRITIARRGGPAAQEIKLLTELCAAVRAEMEINGRPLKKKPLLTHMLASTRIPITETRPDALLAIPARGDVCRIWLLDQGIPWQVTAMAPIHGHVFAAALETETQLAQSILENLAAAAGRLYQWLAEHYDQSAEPYRARMDELFFKKARLQGDLGLLSICAPFRLWSSARRLNLNEVRRRVENGVLGFMDYGSQLEQWSGRESEVLSYKERPISSALPCEDRPISSATIGGRSVLLLTVQQKDFLLNFLALPLVNLNARMKTNNRLLKILSFCRRGFQGLLKAVFPAKVKISNRGHLSREENELCLELEIHWRRALARAAAEDAALPLSLIMIEGRGLCPASWQKNEQGHVLYLRRSHPLTLLALQSIRQDRANSELVFAALMPGHFLTVDNR